MFTYEQISQIYKRYADFNDKFYNEVKTRLESKFGDRIKLFYCFHPGICCVNALARSKNLKVKSVA